MSKLGGLFETNVTIDGFSRLDFDKKKVRKTMGVLGRDVRKEAKRLLSRRAISSAGEYPGKQTGRLQRSIKYKVSKSGFLVKIMPMKTAEMGDDFYPAFLFYGSKTNNLAPRGNFMVDALETRSPNARKVLLNTLENSLIPRK